jgi:hypothetical protein
VVVVGRDGEHDYVRRGLGPELAVFRRKRDAEETAEMFAASGDFQSATAVLAPTVAP